MSEPGDIIRIGPLLMTSLSGVNAIVEEASDPPSLDPEYVSVYDQAPEYVASAVSPLSLTLQFNQIDTYAKRLAILRALNYPRTTDPIPLRAYVGDSDDPVAAEMMVTLNTITRQPGSITATVTAPGGVWTAVEETVIGPVSFDADVAIPMLSQGEAGTFATYKIAWVTNRSAGNSTLGWTYRRQVTITNNTDRDWHDRPRCVDLGDTAAWVTASKAQADGDDIRVRREGYDYARTLVNFNTKRTFAWFLVTIKSGASATFDILYGNANAPAYLDLSTRTGSRKTYVAFDLEGINGTATSGGADTLTDTSRTAMEADRWIGGYIQITGGTGANQRRRIIDNTTATFTVNRNWSTQPDNTSVYVVWRSGVAVDGGRVTAKTANTVTDSSQAWHGNEWDGGTITFLSPSGATPASMTVTSNTADTLTLSANFSVQPAVNDSYVLQRYGAHIYNVDPDVYNTAHIGLWRQNQWYSKPSRIWIHSDPTPGGWAPTLYLDNSDDFAQSRTFDVGTGGGHAENWRGIGRARRSLSQDRTYPDEGQHDGIAIYAPEGYQGIYFDYKLKNENGVGKFIFAVLEPGGESWRNVVTLSTKYASLTAGTQSAQYRDLSNDNSPIRLYMGVLPVDEEAMGGVIVETGEVTARTATTVTDSTKSWQTNVWAGGSLNFSADSTADPKTMTVSSNTGTVLTVPTFTTQPTVGDPYTLERDVAITDEIEFRTNDRMELLLSIDGIGGLTNSIFSVGNEEEIYDLNTKVRLGGGSFSTPPYDRFLVGGKNGHWLHLTSGQELWASTDPKSGRPLAGVYASDTLVYECPWAVRFFHHETNDLGDDTQIVSRAFMPISPFSNLLPNGSFDGNITGWTLFGTDVGVTANWSYESSVSFDGVGGSIKCVISAGPVGDWQTSFSVSPDIDVAGNTAYDASCWARTTNTALEPELTAEFSEFPTLTGGIDSRALAATGTWEPLGVGATSPEGTPSADVQLRVNGNGNVTGTVYFDAVTLGVPNLYITEDEIGELSATVEFKDRFI